MHTHAHTLPGPDGYSVSLNYRRTHADVSVQGVIMNILSGSLLVGHFTRNALTRSTRTRSTRTRSTLALTHLLVAHLLVAHLPVLVAHLLVAQLTRSTFTRNTLTRNINETLALSLSLPLTPHPTPISKGGWPAVGRPCS